VVSATGGLRGAKRFSFSAPLLPVEYVNEAFEEMTGYLEGEILGETPRILQGPETGRAVLDSLREALEKGEEWQDETVNYRKDGEPYRVQWNVSPVRGEDGSISMWSPPGRRSPSTTLSRLLPK